jgi:oligosaccharide repeat unit polymerase
MNYIFLLIIFLVYLLGLLLYKNGINPLFLFIGNFTFSFFILYSVDFIIKDISTWLAVIYFISFVCFILGIFLSRLLIPIGKNSIGDSKHDIPRNVYQREIKILFFITLTSTLIYWSQTVSRFGLNNLFSNLLTSHEMENLSGASSLILYAKMITVFLSPFTLNYMIKYKDKNYFYFIVLLFTFVANISYTRNVLFYILLLDVLVIIYSRETKKKSINIHSLFKYVLIVLTSIGAIRFFTFTQELFNKEFEISGSFLNLEVSPSIATVISYYVGPLVSTEIYLSNTNNVPFLGFTFRNFIDLMAIFGINIDTISYSGQSWVYIPFKFNTSTIHYYIYSEGGILWTIIFFIILGLLADYTYRKFKSYQDTNALMGLILISLILITSIRSYILTRLDILIYIVLLLMLVLLRKVRLK